MKHQTPNRWQICLLLCSMLTVSVRSATLAFHDPTVAQGDDTTNLLGRAPDVTGVTVQFDLLTGAYTATWTATPEDPFHGDLVVNLNLGNARAGPQIVGLSTRFTDLQSTTQFTYGGTSPALTLWLLGDSVVTAGQPPTFQTAFASGDVLLTDINSVYGFRDTLSDSAVVVSEPRVIALLALGVAVLFWTK